MGFVFDKNYIQNSNRRIAMIVANGIVSDSRVLKQAQFLKRKGFLITLYGVNSFGFKQVINSHPFKIVLLPNPSSTLKKVDFDNESLFFKSYYNKFVENLLLEFENNIPDVIHTHDMQGLTIGSVLCRNIEKNQSPLWIHDLHEYVRGLKIDDGKEDIFKFFTEYEIKHIHEPDVLLTVSDPLAVLLEDLYGVKPHVVLNTPRKSDFDSDFEDIRSNLGLDKGTPLAVYSGGVKPIRGVETIIKALPLIPDLHIAFITNKSDSFIDLLKLQAIEFGVSKRVHFHPYAPFNQVTSFLRTADFGIHPIKRYPNAEIALPNKLFEYIHAGLPVIVSNNQAMEEFVQSNKCGEVFEADNAESLAKSIKKIISTPKGSFSKILQNLSQKYSWENQEKVLNEVYSSLKHIKSKKIRYLSYVDNPKIQSFLPESFLAPKSISFVQNYEQVLPAKTPTRIAFVDNKLTRDAIDRLDKNFKVKAIKDFKDLIWADIVIDDLNFGWYSSTAMQAMALGKVVVSHIDDNLRHYLPLPNPIFNTSSDNLLKKLNDILNNWEGSCGRGQVARQFIKNNHCKDSHKLVMDNFLIKEEIEDMGCADHLFNSNNVQGDSEIQSASLAKLTKQVKVLKSKVKKLHSAYLKRGEYLNKLKKALSKKTQSASSRTARKPRLLTMAGRLLKKKTK